MHENRDDYEPIIADRRPRAPQSDDAQPLWRLVLGLSGGVAVLLVLAWFWMSRSPSESLPPQAENSAEALPEDHVEQAPAPPARDLAPSDEIAQTPAQPARDSETETQVAQPTPAAGDSGLSAEPAQPSTPPAGETDSSTTITQPPSASVGDSNASASAQPSAAPREESTSTSDDVRSASIAVRLTSPDSQVRFEVHGPNASGPITRKVGDAIEVVPGTYRFVVSGPELESFEQEVTFDGSQSVEYHVELCAEGRRERESLVGRVIEERTCASSTECESMFMVLSEYADQLVKDRAFRTQQCAKWKPNAAPDGRWTLNTDCGGATLATTCRIEITEGACTVTAPTRSVRGTACPRAELK